VLGFFHTIWHAVLLPLLKKWWPRWSQFAEATGKKHLDSSADPFWPHDSFVCMAVEAMFIALYDVFKTVPLPSTSLPLPSPDGPLQD
jgi:hypothetical protein